VSISRQDLVVNWRQGKHATRDDEVTAEVPLALTYNKRSHVVMMVTPRALEDFAVGFSLVGFARPGRHNVYTFEGRIQNA